MKINLKNLITNLFFLLITFLSFPPMIITSWDELKSLNNIIRIMQILIGIWCILYFMLKKKKIKDIKFGGIILIFLWINISNLINENYNISFFSTTIQVLSYISILKIYSKDIDRILKITSIYCIIITALNLISQIIFTDGIFHSDLRQNWQPYFICGNPNSFVFFYLFAEYIVLLYTYRKKGKINFFTIIYQLMLIYSLSIEQSSTGLIIMILTFFITIFSNKLWIKSIIKLVKKNYKLLLGIAFGLAVWIIIFNGWNNKFVLDIVNKVSSDGSSSFIERGIIWNNSIELISKSPVIGYGTENLRLVVDSNNIERSAHNTYLQLALFGGIPALFLFLILIFNIYKKYGINKNIELYFSILYFSLYLITFLVEQNPFYIGFYALITFIEILSKKNYMESKDV